MQPKVNNSFLILAISLPQDTGLKATSSKKKASGRMDSDDSSRKEEEEEDETPIETTSEKTEKTEPNEGSHGEPNVGKPHVATHAGEQDGKPPVATWKVLREYSSDHEEYNSRKLVTEHIGSRSTITMLSLELRDTFENTIVNAVKIIDYITKTD